jgi:hypothetical protein
MPEKRGHPLLADLMDVTAQRCRYRDVYARLTRQREWLIKLAHLLDPEKARKRKYTARRMKQRVGKFLMRLERDTTTDPDDAIVAAHIIKTVRSRWWGLFTCYRVPKLPATNNDHESFFNHFKQGQRRITGRKAVHAFVMRYGPYAAYLDYRESYSDLLKQLPQVDDTTFVQARRQVREHQARLRKAYRFRHHQAKYLKDLEVRWSMALQQSTQHRQKGS